MKISQGKLRIQLRFTIYGGSITQKREVFHSRRPLHSNGGSGLVARLGPTLVTPCSVVSQASLPMLPFLPARHLHNPGTDPMSLTFLALAGRFFTSGALWEAHSV